MDHIVVTRVPPGDAVHRLSEQFSTWVWDEDRAIPRGALVERIGDADGLYCMLTDPVDEDLLDLAPGLRVVSSMAVGVDNIDLEACRRRGIAVGHTPDVLTDSTADLAWAILMAASRRIPEGVATVATGEWGPWQPDFQLSLDVSGSTLGIIGMGRIGQAIAQRAEGFAMDVVYTSRSVVDGVTARRVDLTTLLNVSDHVVVAVPLTAETRHLIGAAELAAMKQSANLVNIARGPIVDSAALYDALTTAQIRCAALDVTDPEPLPGDHPLVGLPNCLIVPHIGSATLRTRIAMADLAADNLIAGLAGEEMPARVV